MDPEERSVLGVFPTLEEAVAACKRLQEWAKRGITAKELYELWGMFGEDPTIESGGFSHASAVKHWQSGNSRLTVHRRAGRLLLHCGSD